MFISLHKKCFFGGIWLDMNEPANFCNGECNWVDPNNHDAKEEYKHAPYDFPYMVGTPNSYYHDLNYKSLRIFLFKSFSP